MPRTSCQVSQREHNSDRKRRARSWLERSKEVARRREDTRNEEEKSGSYYEEFVFLWIAFNAAYGYDMPDEDASEREKFNNFLREIIKRDGEQSIYNILWNTYSGPIRILLNEKHAFKYFWEWVRGNHGESWHREIEYNKKDAERKLMRRDVHGVLRIVFDRLYVLRNQILHGGATFANGWGRKHVRDGSRIMAVLVPAILTIMEKDIGMDADSKVWGRVAYPRINDDME